MQEKHKNKFYGLWWGVGVVTGILAAMRFLEIQRARKTSPLRPSSVSRTALVTGASSGIGAAYAHQLAAEGYDLVLVARREERLHELAEELTAQHKCVVDVLAADLSDADDVAKLVAYVAALENLEVLVNNAGFGILGDFAQNRVERQEAMIRVHIMATVQLTRAALPGMLARERGAIVNVSSFIAFYPISGSVMYAATKNYLKTFTEALHQEIVGSGVRVQALCPGFTRTEFQEVNKVDVSGLPKFVWMSAEAVVARSLRDLNIGRVVSVPGLGYEIMALLSSFMPLSLLVRLGRGFRATRGLLEDAAREGAAAYCYASLSDLWVDLRYFLQNRVQLRRAKKLIDDALRARLMLVSTAVYGNRACAERYTKFALDQGLSAAEIDALLAGDTQQSPAAVKTALYYARHWAESAMQPDPRAQQKLVTLYGLPRADNIELLLRFARLANCWANSLDRIVIGGGHF